ncbi:serine O-acetyltransferase [Neisseria sp. Ec49-e6-T10]|uniref:serine O-acetyltransferase n=1 Tax=Neisseria sp. Ec49-e6-T10 TaxID=3140744 RepID=UPI003EBD82D2
MDTQQHDIQADIVAEDLWRTIFFEAEQAVKVEPLLASFIHLTVLRHQSLDDVLAFHLSSKLASQVMDARALQELFKEALKEDPQISHAMHADIIACYDRDPACDYYSLPLLYFKGFHAIQSQRVTHWLWHKGHDSLAYFLQNRISEVMGVDIHPAAKLGKGIMIDHGTGVVVGETAVIGDNVSMLHGVTLGGSGKASGDRHPKIKEGVLIGANASILGNITVGECAKVGAGSVVLEDVPAYSTVVGVPARVVANSPKQTPALDMNQNI